MAKGLIILSNAACYEKGERNNNYFLNLEIDYKSKCSIRKIFNGEDVLITVTKCNKKLKDSSLISISEKISRVHLTYDLRAKRKLNFDEVVTYIKQKLPIWR